MQFKFIKHSEISDYLLSEIVNLKSKQWNYTIENHLKWIEENILPDDIHVIMANEKENFGYMNLVEIEVLINAISLPFLGIGNVCASEKGKGYGEMLLIEVNNYLETNNFSGILLCKNNLVEFYSKYRWELIDSENIETREYKQINIMTFNLNQKVKTLDYTGRYF